VLEDVEGRDGVEAAVREGGRQDISDVSSSVNRLALAAAASSMGTGGGGTSMSDAVLAARSASPEHSAGR